MLTLCWEEMVYRVLSFSSKAVSIWRASGRLIVAGGQLESRPTFTSGSVMIGDFEVVAEVDSDGDGEEATVLIGIDTEGLLAESDGVGGNHAVADDFIGVEVMDSVPTISNNEVFFAEAAVVSGNQATADDFPGVEIWNPVLVYTVAIDDVVSGEGDISTGIHMETADFLEADAGVAREHVHRGKPHTQTKSMWGGIGKNSLLFSFLLDI